MANAAADPSLTTILQVAERAGVHHVTTGRMLKKAHVVEALEVKEREWSDKASGAHETARRVVIKAVKAVEKDIDGAETTVIERLAAIKALIDADSKLSEWSGDGTGDVTAADATVARAFKLGRRWERRKWAGPPPSSSVDALAVEVQATDTQGVSGE